MLKTILSYLIIIFSKKAIKRYLLIAFVSLFVGIYIFELYLLSFGYPHVQKVIKLKSKKLKEKNGKMYDKRSKIKVFKDLKTTNENTALALTSLYHQDDNIYTFSGIPHSQTVCCNESGEYMIYQSDRYGFNNPDKEWDKNNIEYLLIGDSFTFGQAVNRPKDITSVLRSLSKKTSINLGNRGLGPLREYAVLREYYKKNTKNIIWLYFEENDLDELKKELKNKILIEYLKKNQYSQNLKQKSEEINLILKNYQNSQLSFLSSAKRFIKLSKLRHYLRIISNKNSYQDTEINISESEEIVIEFEKILTKVNTFALSNKSNLLFVYLPSPLRYLPEYSFKNENYKQILELVKGLNIDLLDINMEIFKKEKDPKKLLPLGFNGHYNEIGYRKIAEAIYNFKPN